MSTSVRQGCQIGGDHPASLGTEEFHHDKRKAAPEEARHAWGPLIHALRRLVTVIIDTLGRRQCLGNILEGDLWMTTLDVGLPILCCKDDRYAINALIPIFRDIQDPDAFFLSRYPLAFSLYLSIAP